ncbi:Protein STR-14 [Aphelenchoides avenae]|nr:Protein STR-14 [Aphelenchus avenae]KAH7712021.1 Protein STR-14 [Aphelenchus avenae]
MSPDACTTGFPRIHHPLESFITLTAIGLNLTLLYLILKHSNGKMEAYKRILLLTCTADMWLATVVFFVQPVHLVGRGNMILVSNGFFAGRSSMMDHVGLAVYCGSLHSSIVCVVVQFFLRYRSICYSNDPKTPTLIWQFIIFAVLYCITQATDATFTFATGHTEEMRRTALEIIQDHYKWQFEDGKLPYPTLSHYTETKTLIHHLFYTVSCTGGYTLVIWCQSQIGSYLMRHGSSFRESTRKMHQDVNRALVALAITPLVSLMGPTFGYIAQVVLDFDAPCTSYVSSVMSMITLVNPLTTMFFVRSYRNAIVRIVSRQDALSSVYSVTKVMQDTRYSEPWSRRPSHVDSICDANGFSRRQSATS